MVGAIGRAEKDARLHLADFRQEKNLKGKKIAENGGRRKKVCPCTDTPYRGNGLFKEDVCYVVTKQLSLLRWRLRNLVLRSLPVRFRSKQSYGRDRVRKRYVQGGEAL